MAHSSKSLPAWWDREFDSSGKPIRTDVRAAAIKVWESVCALVAGIRGNSAEAQELLERAVASVSKYLDKNDVGTEGSQDPGGLLVVAVHRLAWRLSRRESRIQSIGSANELADILRAPDWIGEADRRIFLDKLLSALRPETRTVLRLRMEDLEWEEIGNMLQIDASLARTRFWRDVRKAYLKMVRTPVPNTNCKKQ
jgi:DNA-directed RNA polymerase specialized sigma24 family protein